MTDLGLGQNSLRYREAAEEILSSLGFRHYRDAQGCSAAMLARYLIAAGASGLVLVVSSPERAKVVVGDLAAFLRGIPCRGLDTAFADSTPLELRPPHSPHPNYYVRDRRQEAHRVATLAALTSGERHAPLVLSARGLVRRYLPPDVLRRKSFRFEVGETLEFSDVAEALVQAGYLRTAVVEDPCCFAVRGGIIDAWPALSLGPLRFEFDGERLASARSFDPETQRRGEHVAEGWIFPAQEVLMEPGVRERAGRRLRQLCDEANVPSPRARQLIDEVLGARPFSNPGAYLPALYSLEPLGTFLPNESVVLIEDPAACVREIRAELDALEREEFEGFPLFPKQEFLIDEQALVATLGRYRVTLLHSQAVVAEASAEPSLEGLEACPSDARSLATFGENQRKQGKAAKQVQALDLVQRKVEEASSQGQTVLVSTRSETQSDRLRTLISHRGLELGRGAGKVEVFSSSLCRGATFLAEGMVLLTEEELFGKKRGLPRRSTRSVFAELGQLSPGDHVVHVEHGIGRYQGLSKRRVSSGELEFLVVEYAGNDKLFLPVYRLNQIQKYASEHGAPRIDRLGGRTFAKKKAKVRRRVRDMADTLLRLYAERRNQIRDPLPPVDDDYRSFEAAFPFEETPDQARAIDDVERDFGFTKSDGSPHLWRRWLRQN